MPENVADLVVDVGLFQQSDAGFLPDSATVTLTSKLVVSGSPYQSSAQIYLVQTENPYFVDVSPTDPEQPSWLSFDLRFFKVTENQSQFGVPGVAGSSDAPRFIAAVNGNLNNPNANLNGDSFDGLSQDEDQSALEFQQQNDANQNVFNFALARARLRGTMPAPNVRVFFRLFQAQTNPNT